jgi:hypothetical protein
MVFHEVTDLPQKSIPLCGMETALEPCAAWQSSMIQEQFSQMKVPAIESEGQGGGVLMRKDASTVG